MTAHLIRVNESGIATDKDGRQYRLVPVEPTTHMLVEAMSTQREPHIGFKPPQEYLREAYSEMLSAATVDLEGMAVKPEIVGYWRNEGWGEFTIPTSGAIPEHGWMPVVCLDALGVKP